MSGTRSPERDVPVALEADGQVALQEKVIRKREFPDRAHRLPLRSDDPLGDERAVLPYSDDVVTAVLKALG